MTRELGHFLLFRHFSARPARTNQWESRRAFNDSTFSNCHKEKRTVDTASDLPRGHVEISSHNKEVNLNYK